MATVHSLQARRCSSCQRPLRDRGRWCVGLCALCFEVSLELLNAFRGNRPVGVNKVATIRGSGNYLDWYCCGVEGVVSDEVREAMAKEGWSPE